MRSGIDGVDLPGVHLDGNAAEAVTVSTSSIAPASWTACEISGIDCRAPVEVSAITMPTTFGPVASAALRWSGVKTSPQGRSTLVTFAPARSATSAIREPNMPLTQTTIESPGSIRLTTVVSIPAEPVPLMVIVIWFFVRNSPRSISCSPFMISR